MPELERIRLPAAIGEASALLPVESASLLEALGGPAWWLCHDEGGFESMISLLIGPSTDEGHAGADEWSVVPIELQGDGGKRTDAEALARVGGQILVIGSTFGAKAGEFDARRAFIARFDEGTVSIERGSVVVDVVDLGVAVIDRVTAALGAVELLPSDAPRLSFNIEGAGIVGSDLLLGLRWPVSANGDPLIVRVIGAAELFTGEASGGFEAADVTVHVLDSGASSKRPEGIRGMSVVGHQLHVLTGQTERDLATRKIKAGPSRHLIVGADPNSLRWPATEVQRFEGFRKVEALAPLSAGTWLYALDDEDAIVLLVSSRKL